MSSENFFRTIWGLINIQELPFTYFCKTRGRGQYLNIYESASRLMCRLSTSSLQQFLWHFHLFQIVIIQLLIYAGVCLCQCSHTGWSVVCLVLNCVISVIRLEHLLYPLCSRPVSIQSVWPVKPQRLLPWSVVPVEQPSTDSPSMATGRRKYIPKTTQVSSNCRHALMHACTLCRR